MFCLLVLTIFLQMLTPTLAPELRANPFFALAPTWYTRLMLIALSTLASLIGSQAVIRYDWLLLVLGLVLSFFFQWSFQRFGAEHAAGHASEGANCANEQRTLGTNLHSYRECCSWVLCCGSGCNFQKIGKSCQRVRGFLFCLIDLTTSYRYGLAVCGAMFCDSLLLFPVFRSVEFYVSFFCLIF